MKRLPRLSKVFRACALPDFPTFLLNRIGINTTSMTPHQKPRIGITLGDMNGIGPEVIIKALSDNRILNSITPVIYGSTKAISFYKKLMNNEEFNYSQVRSKGQFAPKSINVVNCWEDN